MQISVKDFYKVAGILNDNKKDVGDEIIKDIHKTNAELMDEEFETPLKKETVNEFLSLVFGREEFDKRLLDSLEDALAVAPANGDVVVNVTRKDLEAIQFAFQEEFNQTSDSDLKEKMVELAKDVSTTDIDKIDTVELPDSVVNSLILVNDKESKAMLDSITEKYSDVSRPRPKM